MAIAILDVESTTYAGDKRASIMELGCVVLDEKTGGVLDDGSTLVRPIFHPGAWCKDALDFTGITLEDLRSAPSPTSVWNQFLPWLGRYAPLAKVYAWNSIFDTALMAKSFPASVHLPWGVCLMRLTSKHLRGNRTGFKLEDAAALLELPVDTDTLHRALPDAKLAASVVQCLIRRGVWEQALADEAEVLAQQARKSARAAERKAEKARKALAALRASAEQHGAV